MRLFKIVLMSVFMMISAMSFAESVVAESKFVQILEGFCFLNKDDFTQIDKMAIALKLKPIPEDHLQADSVIANRGGRGYVVDAAGQQFMIAYGVAAGCSVAAYSINLIELKKIITSVYKLKFVQTNDEGMQIMEFYRFEPGSSYAGDFLTITYARQRNKKDLVSVGYLPEKVYQHFQKQDR